MDDAACNDFFKLTLEKPMLNYIDLKIVTDDKLKLLVDQFCPNYERIRYTPVTNRLDSDWDELVKLYSKLDEMCKSKLKARLLQEHLLCCILNKSMLTRHDFYLVRVTLDHCAETYDRYGEDATNHNIIDLIKSCFAHNSIDEPSLHDEFNKIINLPKLHIPGGLSPCVALGLRIFEMHSESPNFPNTNLAFEDTSSSDFKKVFYDFLSLCEGRLADKSQPYAKDMIAKMNKKENAELPVASRKRTKDLMMFPATPNKRARQEVCIDDTSSAPLPNGYEF